MLNKIAILSSFKLSCNQLNFVKLLKFLDLPIENMLLNGNEFNCDYFKEIYDCDKYFIKKCKFIEVNKPIKNEN